MKNLTYRQLQIRLKEARRLGAKLACKLNAKKEILEYELLKIDFMFGTSDFCFEDVNSPIFLEQFNRWYLIDYCGYTDIDLIDSQNITDKEMLLAEYSRLTKIESIFDYKLAKGDLLGAVNQSVLDCDNSIKIARETISMIRSTKARLNKLAKDAIAKYQPL